jgi:DNA-binding PadR family transcriptional regulator
MEPSPTAHVVLGMLGLGPKSGYEIKRFVDHSTRFFWAAGYAQIYPELRRLAEAGLIEGADAPTGGRRRVVYRLTQAGRRKLRRWLESPSEIHELRDESLLKVFFADAGAPGTAARALLAKRQQHEELAARLRAIEAEAGKSRDSSTLTTLRFGIDLNEWAAGWCEREAGEHQAAGSGRDRAAS